MHTNPKIFTAKPDITRCTERQHQSNPREASLAGQSHKTKLKIQHQKATLYLWGTSVLVRNIDFRLHLCPLGLAYNHGESFTHPGFAAHATNALLSLVFGVQRLFPSPLLPQVMYQGLPQLQLLIAVALCNFLLLSRAWAGGNWCHLCSTAISS